MLLNSFLPTYDVIIATCHQLYIVGGEDAVIDYLVECASYDYKCPDKCDRWAVEFYEENYKEIEGIEYEN